jgi:hypothetical protein
MPKIDFSPQQWWDITCTYAGKPGWAMSVGKTAEEAKANFLHCLMYPELVVISEITPVGVGTVGDALGTKVSKRRSRRKDSG